MAVSITPDNILALAPGVDPEALAVIIPGAVAAAILAAPCLADVPGDSVQAQAAKLILIGAVGNVPIVIAAKLTDAPRLRRLFFDAGVLLIRGAPCDLLEPADWVVIPDLVETHLGNPHGIAVFEGTCHKVRAPDLSLAIAMWTFDDATQLAGGATYNQVLARTTPATFDQVKADPTLIAGK